MLGVLDSHPRSSPKQTGEKISDFDVFVKAGRVILVDAPDPDDVQITRRVRPFDAAHDALNLRAIPKDRALPGVLRQTDR